jgi:hypothetical protein
LLILQEKTFEISCRNNATWTLGPEAIPQCHPVACSPPPLLISHEKNWNISYLIYIQDNPVPAATTFLLICKEERFFVNSIANFTATCSWDG